MIYIYTQYIYLYNIYKKIISIQYIKNKYIICIHIPGNRVAPTTTPRCSSY